MILDLEDYFSLKIKLISILEDFNQWWFWFWCRKIWLKLARARAKCMGQYFVCLLQVHLVSMISNQIDLIHFFSSYFIRSSDEQRHFLIRPSLIDYGYKLHLKSSTFFLSLDKFSRKFQFPFKTESTIGHSTKNSHSQTLLMHGCWAFFLNVSRSTGKNCRNYTDSPLYILFFC